MPHHSSVQAILCHDGAAAPAFFRFAPLSATILEPYLRDEREKKRPQNVENRGACLKAVRMWISRRKVYAE